MRGRKKIPEHLKILKGTQRLHRVNHNAPMPVDALPVAPSWLPDGAREFFGRYVARLEEIGMASVTHTEALGNLAVVAWKVAELSSIVAKEGFFLQVEGREGRVLRHHPAAVQLGEAQRALDCLTGKFGLDPSSQGKMTVERKPKVQSPYAEFGNG